jgi:hypothetical protein
MCLVFPLLHVLYKPESRELRSGLAGFWINTFNPLKRDEMMDICFHFMVEMGGCCSTLFPLSNTEFNFLPGGHLSWQVCCGFPQTLQANIEKLFKSCRPTSVDFLK